MTRSSQSARLHRRSQRHPRKGTSLVELLVALPLALLAATAAATILIRIARTARAQASILTNTSALRHAALVVTADLAPLDGRDLVSVTDTLLEFRSHLGVLEVCGASSNAVVVAVPAWGTDDWVSTLRGGDNIQSWRIDGAPGASPVAVTRPVSGPPELMAASTCGMGQRTVRRWRLLLADSLPIPTIGTPLLVKRTVRYEHYRSGSSWWLGRRSRDGMGWDGLQPVVGPLSSPAGGGVAVRAHSASGAPVATAEQLADSVAQSIAALDITFRMPRRLEEYNRGRGDSAFVSIALRASAPGRRLP
jgi:type II secretory pathway pseudopilin PulG